jgi:hypothetical protein
VRAVKCCDTTHFIRPFSLSLLPSRPLTRALIVSSQAHDPEQPNSGQASAEGKYCAVLRRTGRGASAFTLFLLACENCDARLGRFTCEPGGGVDAAALTPCAQGLLNLRLNAAALGQAAGVAAAALAESAASAAANAGAAAAPYIESARRVLAQETPLPLTATATASDQHSGEPEPGDGAATHDNSSRGHTTGGRPLMPVAGGINALVDAASAFVRGRQPGTAAHGQPAGEGDAAGHRHIENDATPPPAVGGSAVAEPLPGSCPQPARMAGVVPALRLGLASMGVSLPAQLAAAVAAAPRSAATAREDVPRQRLAEVSQSTHSLGDAAAVDVRCLTVTLPKVYEDGTRSVWCARNQRGSGVGMSPRPVTAAPPLPVGLSAVANAGGSAPTAAQVITPASGPLHGGSPLHPLLGSGHQDGTVAGGMAPPGLRIGVPCALPSGHGGATAFPFTSPLARAVSAPASGTNGTAQMVAGGGSDGGGGGDDDLLSPGGSASAYSMPGLMSPPPARTRATGSGAGAVPSQGICMGVQRTPVAGGCPVPAPPQRRASVVALAAARKDNDAFSLDNRLPEWNAQLGSLSMKFLGNRIAASSSKNFLLEMTGAAAEPGAAAATQTPPAVAGNADSAAAGRRSGGRRTPCLQFGKMADGRFSLDYRFPMCPLQAFGIFLSSFTWTLKPRYAPGGGGGGSGASGP